MKRNKFNLSHYKLGSCDMGKLYPISCFEVLPGDTVQMHSSVFLRFAPMLKPVMHPVRVSIYHFYVPTRLLWGDFEDFITGGPTGTDTTTPPMARYTNGVQVGSLEDYFGVPLGYTGLFSSLPHRAYARIFNEYFRDQDLVTEMPSGLDTSNDTWTWDNPIYPMRISWEKDYFTTARPWPQKGPMVSVPVEGLASGNVNITSNGQFISTDWVNSNDNSRTASNRKFNILGVGDGGSTSTYVRGPGVSGSFVDESPNDTGLFSNSLNGTQVAYARFGSQTGLKGTITGLSGNANVRLDNLREAFALQRFEEHRAMYGSRYTEYLRYLGIRSSDARLQRPEYLGGGRNTIQFSEVLQTGSDGDTPVGTLRGHGIGVNRSRTFRRFIEEHGLVMSLMAIRPISIYMNGLNKMFSRQVKEDYWQKELEHIGQQEVLRRELYATGDDASDDTVFGYQNRYDDYRSVPSTVCGLMRTTEDDWHLARNFANAPVLNADFIHGSPSKRIFAEQTQDEIYFLAQNSVVTRRLMSKLGNPIL